MNFVIVHKIDSVLFTLFPEIKDIIDSKEKTEQFFSDFYTIDGIIPKVNVSEEKIQISIDIDRITINNDKLQKASKLADSGDFANAKPLLEELIEDNPYNSEYYRIYGQILSEQGNNEEAINYFIDSLKYDPENKNALIMLGNIYLQYHNDTDTALNFYNKAIELDPEAYLAIYNIGANLLKSNQIEEAKEKIQKSYDINSEYPNSNYSLAQIYEHEKDYIKAFDYYIEAIKNSLPNDYIYNAAIKKLNDLSEYYYHNNTSFFDVVEEFKSDLEKMGGKKIYFLDDIELQNSAKIEIAEYHKREDHLLYYNPNKPYFQHLILHELIHLYLILLARKAGKNKLFIINNEHEKNFYDKSKEIVYKLAKTESERKNIIKIMRTFFNQMTSHIHNSPIDLIIEDMIYKDFPEMRIIQYLSYSNIMNDYLHSTNLFISNQAVPYIVKEVNAVLHISTAMHYKNMYGIDLQNQFKVPLQFKQKARQLFRIYQEVKENREPGMVYDLVHKWAFRLGVRNIFDLIDESEIQQSNWSEDILSSIASDPMNLKDEEAIASKDNRIEEEEHSGKMALVMYCLSAIQYLESRSPEQVKEIAFEIAQLGRMGLNPDEKDKKLHLASIPGKTFSPRQLLAYMYVSWKIVNPDLDTGLDFEEEYQMAKKMMEK
jgi:tetratricopeptide (TPR) repeat protein